MIKEKEALIPEFSNVSLLNCIDLANPDVQSSVSLLKQVCLDSGFFYVINHGIDKEFMDEVFSQSKRFFSLPKEDKMKLLRNEKNRGFTPLFDQSLDPTNQMHGDYKEGYYIGVEVSEDHSDAQKPFYGPNRWPSEDMLPRWRETMEKYYQGALDVARSISRLIALALGLNVNYFCQPGILGKSIATLQLLYYEDQISEPANGIFGAGAHSDFGLITLLATDDNYGLLICKDKDAKPQIWEYVPPLKGAFIVNIGDMLERWSNCFFRSTLHRVLGNGRERYSIAFFVEPNHDCVVECLPTCQSEQNPPKFTPIKCEDYLLQRYKDTHADLNTYK
ncbi:2-oxoglutarate-Fe(II) type oxidoreductase hxnY-like isoform X1 [Salvia splendens]|uniref:2-oxoglutarate-Fe(II) type oxidoreductase hxnY-like isoform X1 n=1 Tax=Salvia splendens TaxID=180675 RepID=UPI001C279B21|nr:2-oxoglutarate-Fe(II) type oxidoreductase hxnY-like isoform X1 [Salvia splendens]XP_042042234.1 2-oxoglutarate-Fe(II) type oxidoreductase hxnY-like isoform X1 [Salvia splendens]